MRLVLLFHGHEIKHHSVTERQYHYELKVLNACVTYSKAYITCYMYTRHSRVISRLSMVKAK